MALFFKLKVILFFGDGRDCGLYDDLVGWKVILVVALLQPGYGLLMMTSP